MPRKIQELRILRSILNLSKDPQKTENVFFIADAMLDMLTPGETAELTEMLMQYPEFKDRYEGRFYPEHYDVGALSVYPEGTLAHAYSAFMKRHGYTSDWYPMRPGDDALTYMRNRLYQTHDFIHTITGFEGTPAGEIGVQTFYLGQMPEAPLPCALIVSAFLGALNGSVEERDRLMHVIESGYEMGRSSPRVLFRKWEEDLGKDMTVLRAELNIKPYSPRPYLQRSPLQLAAL